MSKSNQSTFMLFIALLLTISCSCNSLLGTDSDKPLWQSQIGFGSLIFADAPVQELDNGVLFAGIREPNTILYLIDKATGFVKWEWSDWILPRESVLLRGFYLYQTTLLFQNGENTYAVNIQSGKTLWRIQHQSSARLVTGLGDKFFFTPKFTTIAQGNIESGAYKELFSISEMSGLRVVILFQFNFYHFDTNFYH